MNWKAFLIHQDVALDAVAQRIRESDAGILVVSNHGMFSSEKTELYRLAGREFEIIEERRFFEEEDCLRIDREVWDAECGERGIGYINRIRELKAKHLEEALRRRLGDSIEFYHGEGLGIPGDWWAQRGSMCIGISKTAEQDATALPPPSTRIQARWRQWKATRSWVSCLGEDGLVLGGRLGRIFGRLGGGAEEGMPSLWERLRYGFPRQTRSWPSPRRAFAQPWHDYVPYPGRRTVVLQDGHFPRDYTTSAMLALRRTDAFVPSNPFSEKWARECGWGVVRLTGYADPSFSLVESGHGTGPRKILLALNHAGDWSPFIHRSDTDWLVQEALGIASQEPDILLRVRPHPTMSHSEHEGAGSLERLKALVKLEGSEGVQFTTGPLEDDLAWADVVVSEYSQVLIDAWRSGKLGISFNPTGRRSFVQEYADLGFAQVDDASALTNQLKDLQRLQESQNRAVEAYNRTMAAWRSLPADI